MHSRRFSFLGAEVFDSVEGLMVAVMEVVGTAYRRAADEDNIVPINEKIKILKSDKPRILTAVIKQHTVKTPIFKIA